MPPGSLVLFGAHRAGRFVLDTVFVVASRTPYTIGPSMDLEKEVSRAFRVATLEPLANSGRLHGRTAQLYRGVAHHDRGNQRMFSFVPARLDGKRFCRPALPRSRFVNPDLTMGFKTTPVTQEEARDAWDEAVAQVHSQGLQLGVELAEPKLLAHDPTAAATPPVDPGTVCTQPRPTLTPCAPSPPATPRPC
jgi:hypothetical protein